MDFFRNPSWISLRNIYRIAQGVPIGIPTKFHSGILLDSPSKNPQRNNQETLLGFLLKLLLGITTEIPPWIPSGMFIEIQAVILSGIT